MMIHYLGKIKKCPNDMTDAVCKARFEKPSRKKVFVKILVVVIIIIIIFFWV